MQTIKSNRLVFTEGSSDKEYNVQIVKDDSGGGCKVNFQYGRRNGTLQTGTKTEEPVSQDQAEKIFTKLIKEKMAKGYLPDSSPSSTFSPTNPLPVKETVGLVPQLLNPVSENEFNSLIKDSSFCFQKKYDGERRMAFKDGDKCYGGNRKGQTVSLPNEIIDSLKSEKDIVLDGEIIGSTLYVFDLLNHNGTDYKKESYAKRLSQLNNMKFGPNVIISETAVTLMDKKNLLVKLKADGAEGIVAKDLRAAHSSSRPNSGGPALKFKFYKTATVKVSALTRGKRSVQLSVLSGGKFQDVGAVTIPPNHEIPKMGELVEVRYLYAYKEGCLYQPTYLGVRNDLDDADATVNQLEYKEEV